MQALPQFTTLQAVGSKTFSVPSCFLDSSLSLPELWDYHYEHSPDHPLFVYEDSPNKIRTIPWSQGVRAIHRAARTVQSCVKDAGYSDTTPDNPLVVGILAVKDSCTLWALISGIMRAGYHVFILSPRNSAAAIAHLLKVMNCSLLFVSNDKSTEDLADDATGRIESKIHLLSIPRFEDMFTQDNIAFEKLPPFQLASMDSPALTIHSSGSSSFPKPITATQRALIRWGLTPYYGEIDIGGKITSVHSLPMFHALGVIILTIWPTSTGATMGVFRPSDPPVISTPENLLAGALATQSSIIVAVPSFLESWSLNPDSIPSLKSFHVIITGGGPLSKDVGDMMVEKGVNIRQLYGMTEVGLIGTFSGDFLGKDWEYFKLVPQLSIHLEPQGRNATVYEPIVVASQSDSPRKINTTVGGKPAYATSDLVVPHPTDKSLWKVYGRVDDQIIHSTGEKTNPGPLEAIISRHPSVRACIMFGRAQFQAGVLIEPIADKFFDPSDMNRLAAFRNEIWSNVEEVNQFAPTHSRIFKEMIIVSKPSKPFQFTPKGTPRRQMILDEYEDEIISVYKAAEESGHQDVPPLRSWEQDDCVEFVRNIVRKVLTREVGDEDDLFKNGADSLQATMIRNSIMRAFRESKKNYGRLGQNVVYAQPTIAFLGRFISRLATEGVQADTSPHSSIKEMETLLREYTRNFPVHSASKPPPTNEVVLVTGTTGSLGSHILNKLISLPSISRVYALNRPDKDKSRGLRQRQTLAFEGHGIDLSVLDSAKLVLLEGDTSSPDLGLPIDTLDEIVSSLTAIIHNAWRVNFNLSLTSFKPLVQGVRNLVDIALASPLPQPPRIVFTSSIGTVQNWHESRAAPEIALTDPTIALGSGYGESKWVAERIFDVAREKTALQPVVVRVGQLCGSVANGSWNPLEWFPAMVQSYATVGCLPEVKGLVTWVPIDTAAAAVVDMRCTLSPFVHLVHPKPVQWSTIIKPIAHSLGVPIVPYTEWLAGLETVLSAPYGSTADTVRGNPALQLVEFYRGVKVGGDPSAEALFNVRFDTDEATRASQTLADPSLPILSLEDVSRWLNYWRKRGALKQ